MRMEPVRKCPTEFKSGGTDINENNRTGQIHIAKVNENAGEVELIF
jgi:hypothetical protein